MKRLFHYIIIGFLLYSCTNTKNSKELMNNSPADKVYQYSVFTALANKIYDGNMTLAACKQKGNLGLGTFNGLNGEMIVLDGEFYQWTGEGELHTPSDNEQVPFAVLTFFDSDITLQIDLVNSYAELQSKIYNKLPSLNVPYAFKIHGQFKSIKCGSAHKQSKPYTKTLSNALINRPVFNVNNTTGTLVGFWFPEYASQVNVPGFHLHFIADDKKHAGHVLEFTASDLDVKVDICDGFEIDLIDSEAFLQSNFNLNEKYNNSK